MRRIVIVGSGGREHALAAHLMTHPGVAQVFLAPGNPGMTLTTDVILCPELDWSNSERLVNFCLKNQISWVLVSPDNALADGLCDRLRFAGIKCFGPSQKAAEIESSKIFSKRLMTEALIPTARALFAGSWSDAKTFLQNSSNKDQPVVLKADGLALGKGVIVCQSIEHAEQRIFELESHKSILIEECLQGWETSFFYFADGLDSVFLGAACDHKRLLDGDLGPNTGGMGAFSIDPDFHLRSQVEAEIVKPTLQAMVDQGRPFSGILFVGLMVTQEGPKVIEFNARLGDPETQCLLPLFRKGCLLEAFESVIEGQLAKLNANWDRLDMRSVHVVKVSGGYPSKELSCHHEILGTDQIREWPKSLHFFSASVGQEGSKWVNKGGRVFGVTSVDPDFETARLTAYSYLDQVTFRDSYNRRDIGCKK